MHKILLVTVGGSAQPILTAIDTLQPDRVIFFCSAGSKGSQALVIGEGTPCEIRQGAEVVAKLPNIPTQPGLSNFQPGTDLVLIQNPDDLSECYCLASNTIRTLRQHSPDSQIVADYTGGTFAHGFKPITKGDYQAFSGVVAGFIQTSPSSSNNPAVFAFIEVSFCGFYKL
jgi:hypothetical protein